MPHLPKLAFVFVTLVIFGLSAAQTAIADPFSINLITNGNAEVGVGSPTGAVVPIPGWTTNGNITVVTYANSSGFPTTSSPGPADRGLNFFAGGPGNAFSSASQLVNVSLGAAAIDAGGVTYDLSGYFGGFASTDDEARLFVFFRHENGSVFFTTIGGVLASDRNNVSGLLLRSTSGFVPIGTREIEIRLEMFRASGSYNDGYADNLSLVLNNNIQAVPEPATLLLLGTGLTGIAGAVGRRHRRA